MKNIFLGFKIYYLLYVLVAFTALLNGYSWMNIATIVLTVFGAGVTLCLLVQIKRAHLKIVNIIWIIAFLCSYVLSSVMTAKYGITDNLKEIFWLAFPMLILYASSWQYSVDEMQREFKILSIIYVIYTTIAGAVSLSMLLWGHNYNVVFSENDVRVIGFKWGRLWGVFDDPNHGAAMLVVGIILAVYLILITKNKAGKIVWIITIPVQYLYIVFSDSRTGEVALNAAMLVGIICWLYQKLLREDKKKAGKIIITIVVSFFLIAGNLLLCHEIKGNYNEYVNKKLVEEQSNKSKSTNNTNTKNTGKSNSNPNNNSEVGRKSDIEKDVSNGRISIWKSGLEIFESSPVYGVSFRNITNYTKDNVPDTYIINTEYGGYYDSFHNSLIDILVSQGIIGIIIAAAMLINTLRCFKKNWKYDKKRFKVMGICLTILIALAASSMFLSMVIYLNSPQAYIFWLIFGYLMRLVSVADDRIGQK